MNIGNIAGIIAGIKLVNGRFKPKFDTRSIIIIIFMFILTIAFFIALIYGLIKLETKLIFMGACGVFGFGYILLISPYTQSSKNYKIEFESDNSLNNFKLTYKDKPVLIKYKIDNNGKIAFQDNYHKTDCIMYADGSKMSNITKYRIVNYFVRWLNDNNLMSEEITSTIE